MIENKDIEEIIEELVSGEGLQSLPIIPDVRDNDSFHLGKGEGNMCIPILALRNIVLFPGQIVPVNVSRERSMNVVRLAQEHDCVFGAITQRSEASEDPRRKDLYDVGVIATVENLVELPNGGLGVMLRGLQRFRLHKLRNVSPYLEGEVELIKEQVPGRRNTEFKMLIDTIKSNFIENFKAQDLNIPRAYIDRIDSVNNPTFVINLTITSLGISTASRQALLEMDDLMERGLKVATYQHSELQMLQLKRKLTSRTQSEMDKQQREYFLQQQIRTFQEELSGGNGLDELAEYREQAKTKLWSEDVAKTFEREVRKAERLNPQSPDYSVQTQYLRSILALPWDVYTQDNFDLRGAERKLNREHYGLEQVKERILEHLAVLKLKGDMKSPIICLYGAPGVGKTSLGRSIAESLGRKYVRISLGGVHDEAEIRGHRRTYIGAMSGRIIQGIQRAGSSNPVFLLDEIDKVGSSHKGDLSSALLEVLDPEQNTAFHDNYLDIDYDLSKVLFIATANNVGAIPAPLRDRMEMIEVSGYILEEKIQIARKHLIPNAIKDHGLAGRDIKFTPKAIELIVEDYTRESGVRELNKQIAKIMRKIAWQIASRQEAQIEVTPSEVKTYLGKPVHTRERYEQSDLPGIAVGLAWTSVGGEILYIESSLHQGAESKLSLTGSLGDVMKESAVLALGYIRAHRQELGIDPEVVKDKEIHIHVPEGAVPKDGPSAGITMATAMVSVMTGRRVRPHLAMTGEITLRGRVLPVGGIKEKILAAKRSGITDIILSSENRKDVQDIKAIYLKGLRFHYVQDIAEVLEIALIK